MYQICFILISSTGCYKLSNSLPFLFCLFLIAYLMSKSWLRIYGRPLLSRFWNFLACSSGLGDRNKLSGLMLILFSIFDNGYVVWDQDCY